MGIQVRMTIKPKRQLIMKMPELIKRLTANKGDNKGWVLKHN
jgi:hypothetical protein